MAAAPVAWVPLGAIEYHADHLPFGTDGFTSHAVVERAARSVGGVVLPWSALTMSTLHLPWSLRYSPDLVEATMRATVMQVAAHGARVVVVHTGHAPLDLIHLVKRVCVQIELSEPGGADFRAYGLCYLELNAALGTGLGTDWPVAVDHGSITETSWIMATEPDLVDLPRLPEDPSARMPGVYGPNPRGRASPELGRQQIDACADLLATRVAKLLDGQYVDAYDDLREFVARYWPEPLELAASRSADGMVTVVLRNPGPVSRYLTQVRLHVDGQTLDPASVILVNSTAGEAGVPVTSDTLGAESGFYIRREQAAEVRTGAGAGRAAGHVELDIGLGGVATTRLTATIPPA
jgi:creatinine amidohydrolase